MRWLLLCVSLRTALTSLTLLIPTPVMTIHKPMMASMKMISVHFLSLTGPSKSGGTVSLSCIPTILSPLLLFLSAAFRVKLYRAISLPAVLCFLEAGQPLPETQKGDKGGQVQVYCRHRRMCFGAIKHSPGRSRPGTCSMKSAFSYRWGDVIVCCRCTRRYRVSPTIRAIGGPPCSRDDDNDTYPNKLFQNCFTRNVIFQDLARERSSPLVITYHMNLLPSVLYSSRANGIGHPFYHHTAAAEPVFSLS